MTAQFQTFQMEMANTGTTDTTWKTLYKVGGAAALGTVLVGLAEIGITFLPGGNIAYNTVFDWFTLFHNNWFMGLRNLGLLNILFYALDIPIFFALYGAHRKTGQTFAALAMIVSFIGVAVFYATNRAFAILDISNQYAMATTPAQISILAAAGQAMLSVGQSHTPGTFIAFFLVESASLLISVVMLRDRLFSRTNAYVGLSGFTFMLIFEVCASFVPALQGVVMILAMVGGILSLVWEILVALKLFHLAQNTRGESR
ncbi:MAG: DUF4386 family protein [Chloroflexi bacterium]|nr:DUF4386 family protein [Chloroflexota bacterium]